MQTQKSKRLRRIFLAAVLYIMLWGFIWSFLLVGTRSHNRLTHEPAAMAQLTIDSSCAELTLADAKASWSFPALSQSWCFCAATLSSISADAAVCTWQLLQRIYQS
ncbi:MAG: hypothetical protein LUC50_09650 [Ruminococcus sp.]|nr:hypothetical protein [Ruminococcus sp.]